MIDHVRRLGIFVLNIIVHANPATIEHSNRINSGIEGFKEVDSKLLLDFLVEHIIMGYNFQVRVR